MHVDLDVQFMHYETHLRKRRVGLLPVRKRHLRKRIVIAFDGHPPARRAIETPAQNSGPSMRVAMVIYSV